MPKIICPSCERENQFHLRRNAPSECSFCFEGFNSNIQIIEEAEQESDIIGLTIIEPITNEKLFVPIRTDKIIIGREGYGADFFNKIKNGKFISRVHCSIEYKNNKFYLLDEGARHGTFYGGNKISCSNTAQEIQNKSTIYLAKEAFLIEVNYRQMNDTREEKVIDIKLETKTIRLYRCNDQNCSGYESPTLFEVCPCCGAFKNIVTIYDAQSENVFNQNVPKSGLPDSSQITAEPSKSELSRAIECLLFDYCIIDTNIWMETKKTKLYHGRIGTLKKLYQRENRLIVAHGSTYEELKKFADSQKSESRKLAASKALKMIRNLHKEKILSIPGLKAEHDKTAYADKDIYAYASDEYQTGKSILFITNDNDCNIRVNSSLSDLKRKNNSLPKYEVMDMEQFAKYIDLVHKNP